jgi:hypothetical protein
VIIDEDDLDGDNNNNQLLHPGNDPFFGAMAQEVDDELFDAYHIGEQAHANFEDLMEIIRRASS